MTQNPTNHPAFPDNFALMELPYRHRTEDEGGASTASSYDPALLVQGMDSLAPRLVVLRTRS